MWKIKINPELGAVREKVLYGFEVWQIIDLVIVMLASFLMAVFLPDIGMVKGMVCAIPALPFVLIAFKPVYGLKGMQLLRAAIYTLRNDRPLYFESQEWKKVNENL